MSGNCLNRASYTSNDNLIIPNIEYGKDNILLGHEHEVKVQGAAVSSYYYSPEVVLLYAAPGTPLVRKFANAPKVNVRIMDKPAQLPAVSSFKLLVNGKERTRRGQPKDGVITLDEGTFFKEVAGKATDGLFYQRNGKMFLLGFNEGLIHSVANKKGVDVTYMRIESSRYHVLSTAALNFIKAKTGKDWNSSVRHHIYISK